MQIARSKQFITVSVVALCLALAAQPAQADWIQVGMAVELASGQARIHAYSYTANSQLTLPLTS